jgi:hypothetical protein
MSISHNADITEHAARDPPHTDTARLTAVCASTACRRSVSNTLTSSGMATPQLLQFDRPLAQIRRSRRGIAALRLELPESAFVDSASWLCASYVAI